MEQEIPGNSAYSQILFLYFCRYIDGLVNVKLDNGKKNYSVFTVEDKILGDVLTKIEKSTGKKYNEILETTAPKTLKTIDGIKITFTASTGNRSVRMNKNTKILFITTSTGTHLVLSETMSRIINKHIESCGNLRDCIESAIEEFYIKDGEAENYLKNNVNVY